MVDRERNERLTREYLADHPPTGTEDDDSRQLCPECTAVCCITPDGGTFTLCPQCETRLHIAGDCVPPDPPLFRCDICGASYLVGDAAVSCCRNTGK